MEKVARGLGRGLDEVQRAVPVHRPGVGGGSACFAALGVLLASTSSRTPSNVMMLSSLVRFPLIFVSGVFVPLQELEAAVLAVSYVSPLTYLVDLFNACMNGNSILPLWHRCQ